MLWQQNSSSFFWKLRCWALETKPTWQLGRNRCWSQPLIHRLSLLFGLTWIQWLSLAKYINRFALAALYLAHYLWADFAFPHINKCHSHEQLLWRKDLHENQPSRATSLNNPSASPEAVPAQVLHEVPQVLQKEMNNYNMWQLLGHGAVERRLGHPASPFAFAIQWLFPTMKLKKDIKINKVGFQDEK